MDTTWRRRIAPAETRAVTLADQGRQDRPPKARATGRRQSLTDAEIIGRARPVFLRRGYAARTKEVAEAVGLSWAAVVLRFGGKPGLFSRAIEDPIRQPAEWGAVDSTDLRAMLEGLAAMLAERWPLRLQSRLAKGKPAGDDSELLLDGLTGALETAARAGTVRSDLPSRLLARLVLTLLVGDVAQRYVDGVEMRAADGVSIDGAMALLHGALETEHGDRPG